MSDINAYPRPLAPDQLLETRAVFDKAVTAGFKKPDDLATLRCEYIEMELRHKYVSVG